MGKVQVAELEIHGVSTLAQFAESPAPLPAPPKRGSIETFAKLQRQAQIQLEGRTSGSPKYAFREIEERRGLQRLPLPSQGDVFFDIEGYPRAIGESLEYLLGYVTCDDGVPKYSGDWALNKREERQAFEAFMDFVMERWQRFPDLHIYHFAPYEPAALKRLATRHATREYELDQLLRGGRLVDLYGVVRQGIWASVESYSIKELERFYGFQREQELREASQHLRGIERLIELELTGQLALQSREIVERYNKDDCLSTLALRDWLEELRSELEAIGPAVQRPNPETGDAGEQARQTAAEVDRIYKQLVADIVDEPVTEVQRTRWLLAHMLEYFRREAKTAWWEFFRLHDLEHDELLRERKAVTGLQYVGPVHGAEGRLPTHRYRFVPQEVAVEPDASLVAVQGLKIGHVTAIDQLGYMLDIKKRNDSVDVHPSAVFAFDHISPGSMPECVIDGPWIDEKIETASLPMRVVG